MKFLLDRPETENDYQQLLGEIRMRKNGDLSASMKRQGIEYSVNWGVSVVELRTLARKYKPDHLLAFKLWNKQWRESMILATLLDVPFEVTEEQMDFWTRSFQNSEIAEQASANLWVKTKYAFVKALEWSRGKKHLVRFTGIHLMGRLAIVQKDALDEMFEPFFEELEVLGRDSHLNVFIHRSVLAIGMRSKMLNEQAIQLAKKFKEAPYGHTSELGDTLLIELSGM